jgi:hypothetical protein
VVPRTIPSAPRILTPVPGDSSVTVRWNGPASNGGSAVTGYLVRAYRGSTLVKQVNVGAVGSTVITGLPNGSGHWFVVYARNAAGSGPASARSAVVVPAAKPGAPTLGTATPGNASAVVRWSGPANSGGLPVRSYAINVYSGATKVKTLVVSASARAASITGLANGTSYTFTVTASNALGWGTASATGTVAPRTVPGAPTGVTAVADTGSATVSWVAPASDGGSAITGYVVRAYRGNTLVRQVVVADGAATSAVVGGLSSGVAHGFLVYAVNAAGTGPLSARSAPVTPL